jgi:2-C-methyl-D-erythritol 4-phosphate cytidylyltransferase
VAVQTPQIFAGNILRQALETARREGFRATDETALVEHYGGRVRTVPGSFTNIKVTTPEDFLWVKTMLQERRRQDAGRSGL